MPLIDSTTLLGIADRAAKQYEILQEAFGNADVEGTGWYFDRVSDTDDPDVELPTVQPYRIVDEDIEVDFAIRNGTYMANIIDAMLAHFAIKDSSGIPLQIGGWDGYATTQDVRYSWWFNKLHFAIRNQYLLANNVFSEGDDVFSTVEVTGPATFNVTDGVNYGTGSSTNLANGSNYAATQLKVVVVSFGGTELDMRLSVKDINNLPTTIDVSVPAGSPAGTEIDVGTASDRFLDVMGVSPTPASDYGTLGDTVTIQNKKERTIAL